MGKVNIGGGSPLWLQFEDDNGDPIESIEFNGTKINAQGPEKAFTTDINVAERVSHGKKLNLFRVTDVGKKIATIDFRQQ